jgi:hypothetical protein
MLRLLSSRFVSSELPPPRYELATAGGLRFPLPCSRGARGKSLSRTV